MNLRSGMFLVGRAMAFVAVAACPLTWRMPMPGIPLTVTDLALAGAVMFAAPEMLRSARNLARNRAIEGAWLLVGVCALSSCTATAPAAAWKETFQVALYAGLGAPALRTVLGDAPGRGLLAWALAIALIAGIAAHVCLSAAALIPLIVVACGAVSLWRPVRLRYAVIPFLLVFPLIVWNVAAARNASREPVPQQIREGYAALSVLADAPLLGVGPGNYQLRIGEYYQGMPKDNTMAAGTGIGYTILAASTGLLGVAVYAEWMRRLWRGAARRRWLRLPIVALIGAGFFTPLFVGPMLLMPVLLAAAAPMERPMPARACRRSPRLRTAVGRLGAAGLLLLSFQRVPEDAFTLIWEAEGFAEVAAPMRAAHGVSAASGNGIVELPAGSGQGWRGTGTGSVTYRVDMPHAGQYRLWARTLWKDGCTNALYLQANEGTRFVFGNDPIFGEWHWVKGQLLPLEKGLNYLVLSNHSDGIAIDKLLLTDNPLYAPEGLGDDISRFFEGFAGCDADNTGSWEFLGGRWRVVRGVGEGAAGVNDCLAQWEPAGGTALGGFADWHDYDIKARMMLPGAGGIGFTVYRQGDGNGLRLACESGPSESLFRLVREPGTVLAEARAPGGSADRWFELGLRFEGEAAVGTLDGAELFRAKYGGPRKGQIALFSWGSPAAYFDNINVTFRR